MTRPATSGRPPLQGVVATTPAVGARYVSVRLAGDRATIPALIPTGLTLTPTVGDRLLLDMVGRLPVVRGGAS